VVKTPWSVCSHSCGRGHQLRTHIISKHAAYGGKGCPPLTEARWCNTHDCPADCALTDWSAWGACARKWDHTCVRQRGRDIAALEEQGGRACDTKLVDESACGMDACNDHEECTHLTCTVVNRHRNTNKPCTLDPYNVDSHGRQKCLALLQVHHHGALEAHTGHRCARTGDLADQSCDCKCWHAPAKPQLQV
jgi:hypothetical protein